MRFLIFLLLLSFLFCACSTTRSLHRSAQKNIIRNPVLQHAHVGISIYEPATGKWWYNWQGDKYFVPASNIKIPTCYAAMKYLGDSLVGVRYKRQGDILLITPSGDPTFLHPEFSTQPALQLLKNTGSEINIQYPASVEVWGDGWSWNDYDQSYMVERSAFPVFGNVIWVNDKSFSGRSSQLDTAVVLANKNVSLRPRFFAPNLLFDSTSRIERKQGENSFYLTNGTASKQIPFITNNSFTTLDILKQLLEKRITQGGAFTNNLKDTVLYSQPTDSLLRPMMHRSDNFFAEQALLMVGNEFLGYMNDEKIIDTLLKTDFADLPQPPRWVDGSGLSRYNLFTPQDFVAILQKMKDSFGMDRLRHIFPSGGKGTLSNFYKSDRPFLYAKTGTLAGVVALSGFLTTAKGRELIVSVLVNNHRSGAVQVRQTVENFLQQLRNAY